MSDAHVSRETPDAQTGPFDDPFLPEDARLIADLHHVYAPLAASNARSVERVQARLAEREARFSQTVLQSPTAKRRHRKSLFSLFSQGSAWRRGISTLVAVLLLAVLVGSMATLFALTSHGKKAGLTSHHQHTPVVSATALPPEPAPTPGIYIISEKTFYSAQVSRLDPQTKQPLWTQPVGAMGNALDSGMSPFAPPSKPALAVYGDTIYVAAGDANPSLFNNYVYAINATSGALRWKVTVNNGQDSHTPPQSGDNADNLGALSAPTVAYGIVYVAARNGKLYALDAATGAQLWVYDTHTTTFVNGVLSDASQAVVDQGIVYAAIHNILYALDARSGKQLWTKSVAAAQFFNGPALVNGVLYLSSAGENTSADSQAQTSVIYAYASKDGRQLWQHPVHNWVFTAPTVANDVVYFGSDDHNLYALKASAGSQLWRYNTGGQIFEQPIVANGIVYIDELGNNLGISSDSTVLFAIHAADGKLIWKQPVANMLALEQVQDGVIYVGIWPGQLAALSVEDGSTLWQQHYGATLIDKTGTESEMPTFVTVIS
ncbi:MAG TPA: PQQ-binding-like beta-propeller repeat protein [Ktedonobacterales bacterium]|jgi:outer membrane protein assembly factor BamB